MPQNAVIQFSHALSKRARQHVCAICASFYIYMCVADTTFRSGACALMSFCHQPCGSASKRSLSFCQQSAGGQRSQKFFSRYDTHHVSSKRVCGLQVEYPGMWPFHAQSCYRRLSCYALRAHTRSSWKTLALAWAHYANANDFF